MIYNMKQLFFKPKFAVNNLRFLYPNAMSSIKRRYHSGSNVEINRLIRGYKEFRAAYFNNPDNKLYQDLVQHGQKPKTMVIACSDSRVDPSIILNSAPGQLFVVRNVANLVPPFDNNPKHHGTSAALQFAVETLNVEHIVILGHSHCGGIRALLKQSNSPAEAQQTDFIKSWMNIAKEAKERVLSDNKYKSIEQKEKVCEELSLSTSLDNLMTFPWINKKVVESELFLHAWRFNLKNGILQQLNSDTRQFEDLVADHRDKNGINWKLAK